VNLSLSFIRGLVAAINPCGFVLLPTYLMYFLGISSTEPGSQRAPVRRALVVSITVSAGFILVFLVIGAISEFFTGWLLQNARYATGAIGLAFVVLGAAMLFGYRLPITTPKLDAGGRDRTVVSMFVYGIAYAVASLGCTLPLFISTLFQTGRRSGYWAGVGNVVSYSFGMALIVVALTVTLAVANRGLLRVLRSSSQYVEVIAGAFVLLSGAYLLWYFWKVDVKEEGDPLTDGVQNLQNRLLGYLLDHWGGVALVLGGIVASAALYSTLRERRA
jgi:cytochrome c biogenesis protein CcdA